MNDCVAETLWRFLGGHDGRSLAVPNLTPRNIQVETSNENERILTPVKHKGSCTTIIFILIRPSVGVSRSIRKCVVSGGSVVLAPWA